MCNLKPLFKKYKGSPLLLLIKLVPQRVLVEVVFILQFHWRCALEILSCSVLPNSINSACEVVVSSPVNSKDMCCRWPQAGSGFWWVALGEQSEWHAEAEGLQRGGECPHLFLSQYVNKQLKSRSWSPQPQHRLPPGDRTCSSLLCFSSIFLKKVPGGFLHSKPGDSLSRINQNTALAPGLAY